MYLSIIELLIVFSSSYLITNFITPKVINVGNNLGFFDIPNDRKRHSKPIVRLGGVAIAISFFFVLLLYEIYKNQINAFSYNEYYSLILGTLIIFILGLIDDIFSLSPWPRLAVQFILSILMWLGGIRIENLNLNLFSENNFSLELSNTLSLVITALWLAGFTNSLNWIDGVDGLAGGISAICLIGNIFISYSSGNFLILIISTILLGTLLGFLRFNRKPAKILMGDGGSYFLGYALASISIMNYSFKNTYSFFIPILFFLIPLIDMIFVIFKRLSNAQSPFKADRAHIHHRLIESGFSDTETTNFLFLISSFALTLGISIFLNSINILIISFPIFSFLYFIQRNKNLFNN